MLATLIRATGIGELQFVGGTGQSNGTASATPTFSLTTMKLILQHIAIL
jgi:hypothetical protein